MIECPKCGCDHEPVGIHEEDSGRRHCDSCGYYFRVSIDYNPEYHISCVDCEWGKADESGKQWCENCGRLNMGLNPVDPRLRRRKPEV